MAELTAYQRLARMQESPSKCCWCGQPLRRQPAPDGVWEPWLCWNETQGCWDRQMQFAMMTASSQRGKVGRPTGWLFAPTPRQTEFAEQTRRTKYTLFGGAKAVAKSYGLRWLLYRDCVRIPGLRCLLLRRTYGELESTHLLEMPGDEQRLKPVGAHYRTAIREMGFGNESLIRAGHCDTEMDVAKFLSTQWDRIVFDELVTFPLKMFLAIVSCARSTKDAVIAEGGAQVWGGTNPGGRGSAWMWSLFDDHDPDPEVYPHYDASQWGFVQGWLEDNPYMEPGYRKTLEALPPILRRQWLDGDRNAFEGQFFDWQTAIHVADMGVAA